MLLSSLAFFRSPDKRIHSVAEFLLREQMRDGGWNWERINGATHGSFHTTISVLEGFHEYASFYPTPDTLRILSSAPIRFCYNIDFTSRTAPTQWLTLT